MSWMEIGERLGISDTRVMQLHDRAIEKIRAAVADDPITLADLADWLGIRHSDRQSFVSSQSTPYREPRRRPKQESEPLIEVRGRALSANLPETHPNHA